MIFAVRADGVTLRVDSARGGWMRVGHFADEEERRLSALCREYVEHGVGVARHRAVTEGEDDFLINKAALPRDPCCRPADIRQNQF